MRAVPRNCRVQPVRQQTETHAGLRECIRGCFSRSRLATAETRQLPELKTAFQFWRPMLAVLINPIRNLLINLICNPPLSSSASNFRLRERGRRRGRIISPPQIIRSKITSAMRGSLPTAGEYQMSLPFFSAGLRHAGCPAARHCSTIFLLLGALASRRLVAFQQTRRRDASAPREECFKTF